MAAAAICLLCAGNVQAQTNTNSNTGFFADLQALAQGAIDSPWGASAGFGRSTTGDKDVAYILITDQLITNIDGTGFSSGPIVGYDELWMPHVKQINSLSGGWQLSLTENPFTFTKVSFLTNMVATELAYNLVATPRDSANSIGDIVGTAVMLDFYPKGFDGFHIKALGAYENRTGQGAFNGNYVLFGGVISRNF